MEIKEFNSLSIIEKSTLIKEIIKDHPCAPANDLIFGDKIINFCCDATGKIIKAEADMIPERFGEKIGNSFSILFCHEKEKSRMKVFYRYGEIEGQEKLN